MNEPAVALHLLLFAGAGVLTGFYAGAETASYSVNRIRIRYWAEEGNAVMRRLCALLERHARLVIAMLIAANVAMYLAGQAAYWLTGAFAGGRGETARLPGEMARLPLALELVATLWLAPLMFVTAEVLPKWLFRRRAEALLPAASRVLAATLYLLYPLVRLLAGVAGVFRLLMPGGGERAPLAQVIERAFSRQGIREYAATGAEAGALSREQHELLETLLEDFQRPVELFASPPAFLPVVSEAAPAREAVLRAARRGLSVVLVADDKRDVVGMVYLYDLVGEMARLPDAGDTPVRRYVRPVEEVLLGTPVREVLGKMRSSGRSACLVKDESGVVLGALFLRTVVNMLVG